MRDVWGLLTFIGVLGVLALLWRQQSQAAVSVPVPVTGQPPAPSGQSYLVSTGVMPLAGYVGRFQVPV